MAKATKLESLQAEWKTLFQVTLPEAACSKSPAQPTWPVHVDHCFARIILDNVVGDGEVPWTEKIKSPAWKNLNEEQLRACIEIGNGILCGEKDLVDLDERSLMARGKKSKIKGKSRAIDVQKKEECEESQKDSSIPQKKSKDGRVSKYFTTQSLGKRSCEDDNDIRPSKEKTNHTQIDHKSQSSILSAPSKKARTNSASPSTSPSPPTSTTVPLTPADNDPNTSIFLEKLSNSSKTPFQKRVLSLLLQIPRGQHTTYGLLATHLNSSARAVGNGIRNNPFAPDVPCHRVLATGGGIGGFYGSWGKGGKEGLHDDRKRRLLRDEGVKFDGKGQVVGKPWAGFKGP